jgi:LacI family transcriptional regulator
MTRAAGGTNPTATIRDVADRAGVSIATVSRVITGTANVQAERRDRVQQAMQELGYTPSSLAANLRHQRVQMFAVVVSHIDDPLIAETVQSIQRAASEAGYGLLLSTTGNVAATEAAQLRELMTQRVAGVIVQTSDATAPGISPLLDLGIPVVALERTVRDHRADAVLIDNVDGARRATQHLISLGHRHIGFVGGSRDIEPDALRLAGYETVMRAANLKPIRSSESSRIGGGWLGSSKLLDRHPEMTALIASNSQVALGMLDALHERKVRVPDQLSVLVIDDPFWCGLVRPRLSAFAAPLERMGQSAVRLLLQHRAGEPDHGPTRVVLELELRERDSVRPLATPIA